MALSMISCGGSHWEGSGNKGSRFVYWKVVLNEREFIAKTSIRILRPQDDCPLNSCCERKNFTLAALITGRAEFSLSATLFQT